MKHRILLAAAIAAFAIPAAGASAQFDVAGLAPGVYTLRVTGSSAQVTKRVVGE